MRPPPETQRGGTRAINSLQNERVKMVRSLHMRKARRETGLFVAEFGSGARVPVSVSRTRAYPGLSSTAPSTLPFYGALDELRSTGPVLDAGCGAGEGARALLEAGKEVIGLDIDHTAIDFLREYTPGVRALQADLCAGPPLTGVGAAIVADTLGHVGDPDAFLRSLRGQSADYRTL